MYRVSGRSTPAYDEAHVAAVLAAAGIDIVAEVPSDFIVYCPYHNNYRTPAGEVSKEFGTFYCFSCNEVASLENLVQKVTGKSYFESMRIVGAPRLDLDAAVRKMEDKPIYEQFDQELVSRLHACLNDRARGYFEQRGIHAFEEFELGYSQIHDMVIVPSHSPTGMLVGFQGRSIDGKQFKNSSDLPKRHLLFNLHRVRASSYAYVLESPMDTIRCHQLGIPAVSSYGSGITKEQIEIVFKYFPEVYVVPDRDEAGKKMALTMMKRGATLLPVPMGYNDIGDLDDREIMTLLDRSNPLAGINV